MSGDQANRDLQDYTLTVPANGSVSINVVGEFFNVLASDQATFKIALDGDPATYAKKGTKRKVASGDQFKQITIDNSDNGSTLTVTFVAGFGDYTDGEIQIGGTITLAANTGGLATDTDVSITATTTVLVVAANTARKEVWISNLAANTATMRIGPAAAAAAKGVELPPGGLLIIETTAAIYAYNPGAGAESLAFMEVLS